MATRTTLTFETLLVLVAWALSFFGMAFALFPGDLDSDVESEARYRGFAITFLVLPALDVIQSSPNTSFAPS